MDSQIRLQKWQVDEAQRRISELRRLAERLAGDLQALDDELLREERMAAESPEASRTYPAYRERALERRAKLLASINDLEAQVARATDELALSFGELKKFELVAASFAEKMRLQQDRKDQQRADELGLAIFRRRGR